MNKSMPTCCISDDRYNKILRKIIYQAIPHTIIPVLEKDILLNNGTLNAVCGSSTSKTFYNK